MLQKEQWTTIHALIAQGLSQREIARRLGISRNTVARYATSDDVSCYPGEGLVAELKSLFPSFTLRNH